MACQSARSVLRKGDRPPARRIGRGRQPLLEDDTPNLITNVATTSGPIADGAVTPDVHQDLAERALLPGLHVVDTGYLDAELLVTTPARFGVDLLGPTRKDYHWQAR